jgi:hypothetical protein
MAEEEIFHDTKNPVFNMSVNILSFAPARVPLAFVTADR